MDRSVSVIFDVDGTLWDTSEIVASSWSRAVKENSDLNLSFTPQYLKDNAFGKPMDEIGRVLFPGLPKEEVERLSAICFEYEDRAILREKAVIYEGVRETLLKLHEEGYGLYIVSNCQKGYIEACMKQCGIEDLIRDHLCFGDTGERKGVTIRQLMEKNGVGNAVYVGDTLGDQTASAEAGIGFIHAAYGFGKADHPAYVIEDIRDLSDLLSSMQS